MVFKIIGAGLSAVGKVAGALSKFETKPYSMLIKDDKDNDNYLTILVTTPHKVDGQKVMALVVVGDIDDQTFTSMENDIIVGAAFGNHAILLNKKKKDIEKGKLKILENTVENQTVKNENAERFGNMLALLVYESKYLRKDIKSVADAKGFKFDEEADEAMIRVSADNYFGKYYIKYWEKGMFGENTWVVPEAGVKFWQKVYHFGGEEASILSKNLYNAKLSRDKKMISSAQNAIKDFLKAQES